MGTLDSRGVSVQGLLDSCGLSPRGPEITEDCPEGNPGWLWIVIKG